MFRHADAAAYDLPAAAGGGNLRIPGRTCLSGNVTITTPPLWRGMVACQHDAFGQRHVRRRARNDRCAAARGSAKENCLALRHARSLLRNMACMTTIALRRCSFSRAHNGISRH